MALTDLERIYEREDPAMNFRWIVQYISKPKDSNIEIPVTYVESISLPTPAFETTSGFKKATRFYNASFLDIGGAFNMVLYEDTLFTTTKWLRDWRNFIRHPEQGWYRLPTQYKVNIYVGLLHYAKDEVVAQATIKGVFPKSETPKELSYDSSQRLKVAIDFSVDDVTYEFPSLDSGDDA